MFVSSSAATPRIYARCRKTKQGTLVATIDLRELSSANYSAKFGLPRCVALGHAGTMSRFRHVYPPKLQDSTGNSGDGCGADGPASRGEFYNSLPSHCARLTRFPVVVQAPSLRGAYCIIISSRYCGVRERYVLFSEPSGFSSLRPSVGLSSIVCQGQHSYHKRPLDYNGILTGRLLPSYHRL